MASTTKDTLTMGHSDKGHSDNGTLTKDTLTRTLTRTLVKPNTPKVTS